MGKTRYRNKRILKKRTKKKGGSGFSYGTQRKECPSFTKQWITWLVDLTVAEPLDEAEAYIPKAIELAIKVVDGIEEIMKRFKTDSKGIAGINDQTKPKGSVPTGDSREEAMANQFGELAAATAAAAAAAGTPAGTPATTAATTAGSTPPPPPPPAAATAGHAPPAAATAGHSPPAAATAGHAGHAPPATAATKKPAAPTKKPAATKKPAGHGSTHKQGGNKKRKTKKNRRKILIRSRKR